MKPYSPPQENIIDTTIRDSWGKPPVVKYIIETMVTGLLNKSKKKYVSGIGKNAVFDDEPLGWFLHLEGSHEVIFMGIEKPELKDGDKIRITIEKA